MKYLLLVLMVCFLCSCTTYKGVVIHKEYTKDMQSCNCLVQIKKNIKIDIYTFTDRVWLITDCLRFDVSKKCKFKVKK